MICLEVIQAVHLVRFTLSNLCFVVIDKYVNLPAAQLSFPDFGAYNTF